MARINEEYNELAGRKMKRQNGFLILNLRSREEVSKRNNVWNETIMAKKLPINETAILICDMWDKHWCKGATERVANMVGKVNSVVKTARKNGVQIIHSPSDTMDFYDDSPYRKKILEVPRVEPPNSIEIPALPPLPIDDSDGGCDTGETPWYKAWTRQHPAIEIKGRDVISDNGQDIYSFMQYHDIKNLVFMGVHTNMCILGRSFGIKQMKNWGVNCILVRDLTDAMYNPKRPPYVSHERGTGLVIEYIEKYLCSTILSDELLMM